MRFAAPIGMMVVLVALGACTATDVTHIDYSRATTVNQATVVTVIGKGDTSINASQTSVYTDSTGRACRAYEFQDQRGQGTASICYDGQNWILVDKIYVAQADKPPAASTGGAKQGDWNAVTD